jgi:AraC family transcriptional regulator
MLISIKNMVCQRCILAVEAAALKIGLTPQHIGLGELQLAEDSLSPEQVRRLDTELEALGFSRIDDKNQRLIEQTKSLLIRLIHQSPAQDLHQKWSVMLEEALEVDYKRLSQLFSLVEGITLEQYIIRQRIERAKELLVYDELSLSEIAYQLGYSSVAHLSSQFKKVTGLTPSHFKQLKDHKRKPLDQL